MMRDDPTGMSGPTNGRGGSGQRVGVQGTNVSPLYARGRSSEGAGTRALMAHDHLDRIQSARGASWDVRPFEGPPRPHTGESPNMGTPILDLLGAEAESLLKHTCKTISKESLN